MLSVHYYTPSDFTLPNQSSGNETVWDMYGEYGIGHMVQQLGKVAEYGIPLYLGEYSAAFKDNIPEVVKYVGALNAAARFAEEITGTSVSTAYWDNGVVGVDSNGGTGIINRIFNIVTPSGSTIDEAILNNFS